MRAQSPQREKTFFLGILVTFVGLGGLAIPNLSGIFRVGAGSCLALGVLLYQEAFFVGAWEEWANWTTLERSSWVFVATNCGRGPRAWSTTR
jgi:hypothetical protein